MAIVSASIESNGWVLALRGTWGATTWADFALDPDGTPKLTVSLVSQGFGRQGGQAVAVSQTRSMVATKALRRPWPDQALVDETDNGDGTRTLRLALSERVYQTDLALSLSVAAGWRSGEPAAVLEPSNGSTRTVPLPIVRQATPFMTLVDGPGTRLDLLVASHFARHDGAALHQAVAAVKLEATDGTTTNTVWLTSMSTSTAYGDDLRCWGVDPVESGLFSGLNNGYVTTHWTVYPWVGLPRTSGSGQDVSGTGSRYFQYAAEVPFMCAWDPGRTLFGQRYVMVDAATGTTTASASMVQPTLAQAKAQVPAATLSVAMQAIYLANISIPAANGYAASARAVAGTTVVLKAGAQSFGTTSISALSPSFFGLYVVGDPEDPDPRSNCILRSGSAVMGTNAGYKFRFMNLTMQLGQSAIYSPVGGARFHFDNCTIEGKPGYQTSSNPIFNAATPAGTFNITAVNSKWWNYGAGLAGISHRAGLLRNVVTSRPAEGITIVNCTKIEDAQVISQYDSWGFYDGIADQMMWGCKAYKNGGNLFGPGMYAGNGTAETPYYSLRTAIVNTLVERATASETRFFTYGEGSSSEMHDCIFDSVTAVGNGINTHSEGAQQAFSANYVGNAFINSWIDRNATKQDVFTQDGTKLKGWELLYGVGNRGGVHNNRIYGSFYQFQHEYYGRNSAVYPVWLSNPWGSNDWPKYVNDLSSAGPTNPVFGGGATAGNGDYRPAAGSPALARGGPSNIDRYLTRETKPIVPAAGALPPAEISAGPVDLLVESAQHQMGASETLLSASAPVAALLPAGGALVIDGEANVAADGGAVQPGHCTIAPDDQVRVLRVLPD